MSELRRYRPSPVVRRPLATHALRTVMALAALSVVLAASYGALTHRRFEAVNGTPGEVLPGHTIGQSFISRYPKLSGIEVRLGTYRDGAGPARASLVMHLREWPGIAGQGSDLRTATLPAGTSLDVNPWYLFSFPPIADSQNRTYYFEVESPDARPGEALTLFWWQPIAPQVGDPYKDGVAYRDTTPRQGDLSFGLSYSPSPLDAWAQMLRAASVNSNPWLVATCLLVAVLTVLLVRSLQRRTVNDTQHTTTSNRLSPTVTRSLTPAVRRFSSLLIVLLIAFANGIVYLLAIPPWQGPDEHAHFAYAALLDRYDFDVERVRNLQPAEYEALGRVVNTSMDLNDFSRRLSWHSAPGASADAGRTLLSEVAQPPAYYWLSAVTWRLLRSVGISADPYTNPEGALRAMRVLSLLLSLGVVALAWVAGRMLSRQQALRVLLPLTVALLPMYAFLSSTSNNDLLAELSVSALFVCLVALLKRPMGARGVALAALSILLAIGSGFTKSSALAAAIPLLALGLIVWAGMLATRALGRRGAARGRRRNALLVPAVGTGLLLLIAVALPLLALMPTNAAVGWNTSYWPVARPERVRSDSAHQGEYVLEVDPREANNLPRQTLVPPVFHPSLLVTFSGWARLSPDAAGAISTTATLLVTEGASIAGRGEVTLRVPGEWISISGRAWITESAEQVTLQLLEGSEDAQIQFDDLSASVESSTRPWDDQIHARRGLLNPSFEEGAVALNSTFAGILPFEARQIADALANPLPFDKGALWGYYGAEEYRSFWGNFGWVSIPLPAALYWLLGGIVALALAGLAWVGARLWGKWSWREWLGLVSAGGVGAAILLGFARQMTLLADLGVAAYPEGRYLFVLIIPIAWLLIAGISGIFTLAARDLRRLALRRSTGDAQPTPAQANVPVPWGVWLWLTSLLFFASYCILALVMPYFYG